MNQKVGVQMNRGYSGQGFKKDLKTNRSHYRVSTLPDEEENENVSNNHSMRLSTQQDELGKMLMNELKGEILDNLYSSAHER